MDMFRVVSGWILLIGGIGLAVIGIFFPPVLIYSVIAIVMGILLIIDIGKEDIIEKIKSKNLQRVLTTPATDKHKKRRK